LYSEDLLPLTRATEGCGKLYSEDLLPLTRATEGRGKLYSKDLSQLTLFTYGDKIGRIKWLGHISRMVDIRITNKILTEKIQENRSYGIPRRTGMLMNRASGCGHSWLRY
jgi:hypothetical protein